jgi:hypothetical protein
LDHPIYYRKIQKIINREIKFRILK